MFSHVLVYLDHQSLFDQNIKNQEKISIKQHKINVPIYLSI